MPSRKPRKPTPAEPVLAETPGEPLPDPIEPLSLGEKAELALTRQVRDDISNTRSVFSSYINKLKDLRDLHDGEVAPSWEPFKESSKVFVPLPRVIKDAAHSRIWQTIFQQKEVAIVESELQESDVRKEDGFELYPALKAVQRAINKIALSEKELNLKVRLDAIINEITIAGTCPVRVFHERCVIPQKLRYDKRGQLTTERSFVDTDRVAISALQVESCLWDTDNDSDRIRFFAFEYTLDPSEAKLRATEQKWSKELRDKIFVSTTSQLPPANADTRRRERLSETPANPVLRFWEVYYRNIEVREGVWADICITYHEPTNRIARIILWPYIHNEMPIVIANYETARDRPIGRGAIEPVSSIAAGVNAITNQTINSATIRDNPGLVVPENSEASKTLADGWYPGIILTERVKGEIRPIEFGQVGNTQALLALQDRLLSLAFQVSHLGPSQLGDVSVSRRSPASLGLNIMQQGAELIDKIINRFRVTVGQILLQSFAIYWQVYRSRLRRIVGLEDFELISKLVNSRGIDHLRVTLAVTSASYSKELDRQNYLAMIQVVLGYERQILELVRETEGGVDPKTGQAIQPSETFKAVALATMRDTFNLMTRWVESFPQVTDATSVVTDAASILTEVQQAMQRMGEQIQALQAEMGGGGAMAAGMGAPSMMGGPAPMSPPGGVGLGAGSLLPQ